MVFACSSWPTEVPFSIAGSDESLESAMKRNDTKLNGRGFKWRWTIAIRGRVRPSSLGFI